MSDNAPPFVHLRLHSEYDLDKGAARLSGPNNVIDHAAQLHYPALALTDTNAIFGAVKFYQQCRQFGIKPIIGAELTISENKKHHILLLCMSQNGYENLSHLLSHVQGDYLPLSHLTPDVTTDLIALSGGWRGQLHHHLINDQVEQAIEHVTTLKKLFPDRLYLEAWHLQNGDKQHLLALSNIGEQTGTPLVATHPVQCARRDDSEMLETRLCISHSSTLDNEDRPQPICNHPYLLSAQEMQDKFVDFEGALANSVEIAKRCNFAFNLGQTLLPTIAQDKSTVQQQMRQCAEAGLAKKLKVASFEDVAPDYQERLNFELTVIDKMNYADYFLIVMDFVAWAKNNDISVGPGRGSGAGSLVAYALDITTIDPIQYGLLFERFLNPDRVSMPDFDIDFCVDGRDRVIDYVEQKYGSDRVAQIVTFGTIGAKSAVRDVARVQSLPYSQSDRIAKTIPNTPGITLKDAIDKSKEFAAHQAQEGALIELAIKIEGLPRNIGTHAGGVLIAPDKIEKFCPTTLASDSNSPISQFDMIDVEKIGLVKFDFLGLRTLTIIAQAEKHLKASGAVAETFSIEDIPLDDKKVYQLYCSGDMVGVFQCESGGMCRLMKNLKPDRFADIIALVALYRPGPLESGSVDNYIDRKHKRQATVYPHPDTQAALAETYGVIIYQEQIMEVAKILAGYSLAEADLLRRAMGKKKVDEMAAQQNRFIEGSQGKLSAPAAKSLFEDIEKFAGYGFNKSHATAYALLSYRTAYLKTHYPAIFIAAVMSAESGNTDNLKILCQEAKRLNITVTAPDINISDADFKVADGKIIYGLSAIKGMGTALAERIVSERQKKPYQNLFDFCQRLKADIGISVSVLEALTHAGAFDCFDPNRQAVKKTLPVAFSEQSLTESLFADAPTIAECEEESQQQKLQHEADALGFTFSGTFYDTHKNILPLLPLTQPTIKQIKSGRTVVAGTMVRLAVPNWLRKGNKALLILADNNDELEVIVNASCHQYIKSRATQHDLLIAYGDMGDRKTDAPRLYGDVLTLSDYFEQKLTRLTLLCQQNQLNAIANNMLPSNTRHATEVILQCHADNIDFALSLQKKWAISDLTYTRLGEIVGRGNIRLNFTY